jgi:hypothetical protein
VRTAQASPLTATAVGSGIILLIGACALLPPRGTVLPTPGSECLVVPSAEWFVLRPEAYAPGTDTRRAIRLDVHGDMYEGAWWRAGDTLSIAWHDNFSATLLHLRHDAGVYRGVEDVTTDSFVLEDGVYRPSRHASAAELRTVPCSKIPRAGPEPPARE